MVKYFCDKCLLETKGEFSLTTLYTPIKAVSICSLCYAKWTMLCKEFFSE